MLILIISLAGLVVFSITVKINGNYGARLLAYLFCSVLVCCSVIAIGVQITKEVEYEKKVVEREILLDGLEKENSAFIYEKIIAFNNDVRVHKRYSDSPWIGLFHNDKIATLEYIELN